MKLEEMEDRTVYLKCPDYNCKLWNEEIRCEYDCPRKSELEKKIKCWKCKEIIKLPVNYSIFRRVNHICKDGSAPLIFQSKIVIIREDINENE
jgi:hypothetical protein